MKLRTVGAEHRDKRMGWPSLKADATSISVVCPICGLKLEYHYKRGGLATAIRNTLRTHLQGVHRKGQRERSIIADAAAAANSTPHRPVRRDLR